MTLGASQDTETVTIPRSLYARLLADSKFLARLHAAGVDNWNGYHYGFAADEEDI